MQQPIDNPAAEPNGAGRKTTEGLRLAAIVAALGGELHGDSGFEVDRLSSLESAGPSDLSFVTDARHAQSLNTTRAGVVIVATSMLAAALARQGGGSACIVVDRPHRYFAQLTRLWKQHACGAPPRGVHPSAVVDPSAHIHEDCYIGPLCVVERGVRIGAGTQLKSRVTVGEDCVLGQRCIVHPGAVIGADGFGFAPHAGQWEKIEQLGAVRIGDDVEIGANTCIDRGAIDDTVIEDGVKLDNLIQIAHNVRIGAHTAMAACVGVAGSAHIGAHCTFGGAAMIAGSSDDRRPRQHFARHARESLDRPSRHLHRLLSDGRQCVAGRRTPQHCGSCMRCANACAH